MLMDTLNIVRYYVQSNKLTRLKDQVALRNHQQAALVKLRAAMTRSSFYREYVHRPFAEWPIISKQKWMANFDAINTVGIKRSEAEGLAMRAERERNFKSTINGIVVGLSTGTSGARGVFLASRRERQRWAGAILSKLLPRGLRQRERVALVLRADSGLYNTVASGSWIKFSFFDTTKPLTELRQRLSEFAPTIIVGPPSVLRLLSEPPQPTSMTSLRLLVCGAEVLDEADRQFLTARYGVPIAEIYQATEGFIGVTCRYGRMHLNEEYLLIEKEWLDQSQRRFVPIVTDMYRHAQPVIRYRLNDVLTESELPCECGMATMSIDRIEGREADVFWVRAANETNWIPIFADVLARHLLMAAPEINDYQIIQTHADRWLVATQPVLPMSKHSAIRSQLQSCAAVAGGRAPTVDFDCHSLATETIQSKRRRVRRDWRRESET